jgi:hypothetical protein
MFKTPNTLLSALALVIVLASASPALAGPPLICIPFDTGSTRLLAWGSGTSNWNAALPSYNLKALTADTLRALDADAAVLSRMENLRRATIYAMRDPAIAHELLQTMIGRALSTSTTAAAWFDAGYVVEAYKQATHLRGPNGRFDRVAWAATDETLRVDGYGFVKKAIAMGGPSAEMEFAASLMTQGAVASAHRSRARAAAARGSFLAANLAKY